jgi:hypothetical protein
MVRNVASRRTPEGIAACTPSNLTMLDYSRYLKTGNFQSRDFYFNGN